MGAQMVEGNGPTIMLVLSPRVSGNCSEKSEGNLN